MERKCGYHTMKSIGIEIRTPPTPKIELDLGECSYYSEVESREIFIYSEKLDLDIPINKSTFNEIVNFIN